jgi:hypothetical protein
MADEPKGRASSAAALWIVLLRAQRASLTFFQSGVTLHGMNIPDFELLEALLHKGAIAIPDVARKLGTAEASSNRRRSD